MPDTKKKYTENTDKVINEGFDPTANVDAVGKWSGGNGVGSKSNIEKLASDYVNSNYDEFTKGEDFASLAKRFGQQGQQAMKDTLGQVSARTGGLASSYATQAAQQSYNGYMEKLEDAARSLYDSQMAEKASKLGVAQGLYDTAYGEHRQDVTDAQWRDGVASTAWRDRITDAKWLDDQQVRADEIEYQRGVDAEAKDKADKAEAQNTVMTMWAAGVTPPDELLQDAGWYEEKINDPRYSWASSGLNDSGNAYKELALAASNEDVEGEPEPEPEIIPLTYKYGYTDNNGNLVYYDQNGDTKIFGPGINPYTGKRNPDVDMGAFPNGYQPNNVRGVEVEDQGKIVEFDDGSTAPIYLSTYGIYYYWDEEKNQYINLTAKEVEKYGLKEVKG